ncbi:MAG: SDR family oxidoreductase [Ignavibacteria bacterium]|jgi:NAD(P)-dependent dehydrogenase (short-subunit alcohol dehydrogenase family)|nr:SDR family oxidoreductase [Ignavibacteria bacterium]MDH7526721.1 SDR family oxidoreductase [Ignavibacteria bacterium]
MNKIALITGATSGIGNATLRKFIAEGFFVVGVGRNQNKLDELKNEFGDSIDVYRADVSKKEDRINLVEYLKSKNYELDVLVNSAGILRNGTIENTSLEAWNEMIETNLTSTFHLMNLCIPLLEKKKGSIVNVSSVTGLRSFPNILAYCVSKAGVDHLTRCAALELAPKGIRVNAVNPGVVVTNCHLNSGMDQEAYNRFLEHSKTTHPIGRVGKAEEIADLIFFLASEKAGWITGETIAIDGGRHLTCAR